MVPSNNHALTHAKEMLGFTLSSVLFCPVAELGYLFLDQYSDAQESRLCHSREVNGTSYYGELLY